MVTAGVTSQIHAIILTTLTMSETWPGTGSLTLRKRDGGRRGKRSKCESAFGPASMRLPNRERERGENQESQKTGKKETTLGISI
jgi:hypothetical protein